MTIPAATSLLLPGAALLALAALQASPPAPRSDPGAGAHPAQPVAWGDFDGDGRLDALSTDARGRLRLLASRAEAGFEDVTDSAGLAGIDAVAVALWGDYDADGRMDLFVGRGAGASLLLRNEGASFVDMAAGAGLVIEEPVRGAHWLDEDGDRRLDLHVVTDGSSRIWRGLAGGFFEPVELPLASGAAAPGAGGAWSLPGATDAGDAGGRVPTAAPFAGASSDLDRGGVTKAPSSSAQPVIGPPPLTGVATPIAFSGCAVTITDQADPGTCLEASSTAALGKLYPLSSKLFVSEAGGGRVGINTTTPSYRLHVEGQAISGVGSTAISSTSTVSGGSGNQAFGAGSTVAGGSSNRAGDAFVILSDGCTVGGGVSNVAGALLKPYATVSGGRQNSATGEACVVGGGNGNTAGAAPYATVSGGQLSSATGFGATVPGGSANLASGDTSFAAGLRAKAIHSGAFVWGDGTISDDKPSAAAHEFNVYADGGLRFFATGVAAPSMVVDDTGEVGIGTPTPLDALHVEGVIRSAGASGGQVASYNPNNQSASVNMSWLADVARLRVGGSGAGGQNGLDIQTQSDVSLMRLLHNGNVGIGTTTPGFDLEVNGTAGKPGGGSWSVASDARLKKDVEDLEDALATLLALRGVTFEYLDPAAIGELAGRRIGFLAQEVERVLPDWVAEKEDGTKYLTIRGFEALAVEALRELERKGAALEQQNAEKDARIAELEARVAELERMRAGVAALSARLAALER